MDTVEGGKVWCIESFVSLRKKVELTSLGFNPSSFPCTICDLISLLSFHADF